MKKLYSLLFVSAILTLVFTNVQTTCAQSVVARDVPMYISGDEKVAFDGYAVCLSDEENGKYLPNATIVEVLDSKLDEARESRHLVLPDKVVYENVEYYVTAIGGNVFKDKNLETIEELTLPERLQMIFGMNFYDMPDLKKVNSGNMITSISSDNFSDMPLLEEVNFQDIDVITAGTFCNIGIRSLRLVKCRATLSGAVHANSNGNSWRQRGTACSYMPNLVELDLGSMVTIEDDSFNNLPVLRRVTIPTSCELLGAYTFSAMENLTEVSFAGRNGKSISISVETFADCPKLKDVYVNDAVPFSVVSDMHMNYEVDNLFDPENVTLHVPAGAAEAYAADPYWGRFGAIVDDSAGVDEIGADSGDGPAEYFTLQGVRVENPSPGIYIRRSGSAVSKVVVP